MSLSSPDSAELKEMIKVAVVEALGENRELLRTVLTEVLEDIAFARAMDEAEDETVSSDEIDRLLERGQ